MGWGGDDGDFLTPHPVKNPCRAGEDERGGDPRVYRDPCRFFFLIILNALFYGSSTCRPAYNGLQCFFLNYQHHKHVGEAL